MKMLGLCWPIIMVMTAGLYLLTIIVLPFNAVNATILLFALIAFWSRLPGVSIPHPLLFLYYLDFVDIFSMLIAINVGPMQGVVFTLFANYSSRAVGVFPDWIMVIKDGAAQSFACILIPFVHVWLGSNIYSSVIAYALLRAVGFFILWMIWSPWGLIKQLTIQISENTVVLFINILYARLFGGFLDGLLKKGVTFNWVLFGFATVVIAIFYVMMYGIGELTAGKKVGKRIVKTIVGDKKKERVERGTNFEMEELQKIKDSLYYSN